MKRTQILKERNLDAVVCAGRGEKPYVVLIGKGNALEGICEACAEKEGLLTVIRMIKRNFDSYDINEGLEILNRE